MESLRQEQISQEMYARDWERTQLLQLLLQKDAKLQQEHATASKHRAALAAARDTARYLRALCVLRAWQEHVQRLAWERQLSRAKSRYTTAALRSSCRSLNSSLKSAVGRQMGEAMRKLWVHCACQTTTEMPRRSRAVSSSAQALVSDCVDHFKRAATTEQPSAVETPLGSPIWIGRRVVLNEQGDDQVLFATPDRNTQSRDASPKLRRSSPHLKSAHQRHLSPLSDDSRTTGVPSSSSQSRVASTVSSQSRAGLSTNANPFAIARLPQVLESISRRRLFWALSQWRGLETSTPGVVKAHNTAAGPQRSSCHHQGDALACESSRLEPTDQDWLAAKATIDVLRSRCSALEGQASALVGVDTSQRARLRLAQVREEALEQGSMRLEEELLRRSACEQHAQEALASEEGVARELRLQLQRLQESRAYSDSKNEGTMRRCSSSEKLLVSSEQSCAALEMKLARRALWRDKAERRMLEMAACGKELERDQAQLRQKLAEATCETRGAQEQAMRLRCSLEHAEQAQDVLTARAWAMEEDMAALKRSLEQKETQRLQEAARHDDGLEVARRAEAGTLLELAAAQGAARSELQAAEAARTMLMAAWEGERHQMSRHSAECITELQQQLMQLSQELQTSMQFGKNEGDAAAQARREDDAREKAVAALQAELENEAHAPPTFSSGISTPHLHELDAYAALVERLKTELGREREMRQAESQSLEALRSSYRLLLQRVSARASGTCE